MVKQEGWVVDQGPGDILRAVQAFIGQLFGAKIDGPLERGEVWRRVARSAARDAGRSQEPAAALEQLRGAAGVVRGASIRDVRNPFAYARRGLRQPL